MPNNKTKRQENENHSISCNTSSLILNIPSTLAFISLDILMRFSLSGYISIFIPSVLLSARLHNNVSCLMKSKVPSRKPLKYRP